MATIGEKDKKIYDTLNDYQKTLFRDWTEDLRAHDDAIVDFDAYEAMDNAKTYDAVSKETGNGLTDSMTATIYLERAARVAGQLPSGETRAHGRKDYGKGLFMDILREKWIYPNANAQRSFKTKMFMWQYGSSEYGYMPMYIDLNVSPSGYFGPDCWLWNPRNFVPQNGFTTVADMDYVHAIAYKSASWFEDILDEESDNKELNKRSGWRFEQIKSLKDQIKNKTQTQQDPSRNTLNQRLKHKQDTRQIMVVTRYEAGSGGKWVTFLPDFGYKVIRSIKNPHKNGRIPFVIKPCIPKFDSFYNIGDFQRSMPMQFANDGLDNFYFQGIKINLFPPIIINSNGVVRHTIKPGEAGSVWETTGPIQGNIQRLDTSLAGLNTYQAAKGMARGAVQSIAGTTDTRANAENASDPGMGKTPEALRMIGEREATRDGQDRDFLEEAMSEMIDLMYSIIPTIASKIPVDLFSDEIEEIMQSGHDDLGDIFLKAKKEKILGFRMSESGEQMRIRLNPQMLKGLEYRFQLEAGSTAKKTKEGQLMGMIDFLTFLGKMPNALEQLQAATGLIPDWQHIVSTYGRLADIPGMDKFFTKAPEPKQPETPEAGGGGGLTPEVVASIAQAGAAPPEAVAAGAVMPPGQPPAPPAPPAEDELTVAGFKFSTPEGAAEARQMIMEAQQMLAGRQA